MMDTLFYDGNMIYQSGIGYGVFIAVHHAHIPKNLKLLVLWAMTVELTLPGPPMVCTSRAFHVTTNHLFTAFEGTTVPSC